MARKLKPHKEVFGKDKTLKSKLLKAMPHERLDLRSELKRFLPVSQHLLLKNFNRTLLSEIERDLP